MKFKRIELRAAAKTSSSFLNLGMIIFSDPADVAVEGTDSENLYPNTIFLPGTGVQRGSVYIGDGDPLSPYWASIPNAYR